MLKISKSQKKDISKLITISFNKHQLNPKNIKYIIAQLLKQPSTKSIPMIKEYLSQLKYKLAQSTAEVTSAMLLTDQQQKQLHLRLAKKFNLTQINFLQDSSLLGGVQVKIGDAIIDNSIRSKIDQVAQAIRQ